MKVLITGATGLIGSALVERLRRSPHEIVPLSRSITQPADAFWNSELDQVEFGKDARFDAVIHLAGETVAQRWTVKTKQRIHDSRVETTHALCQSLAQQTPRPATLLCASATGFYGDRGDESLDEQSAPGKGFLAEVCQEWEGATEPAKAAGIRVVNLRFGIVLSRNGGALKKMFPIFRAGLGGKIGSGNQFWSWIALEDAISATETMLTSSTFSGPVNVVSPQSVRNIDFIKAIGIAVNRPVWFTVPAFAVKLAMGEMGKEALLASFRVKPTKLLDQSFRFAFPDLASALENA
jgi:uncharacterized protein (TIGR01777 family)